MANIESSQLENVPAVLLAHGIEVFGTEDQFMRWMTTANFYFDKKAPLEFTTTTEGLKFINDRLTGIQYGDNA